MGYVYVLESPIIHYFGTDKKHLKKMGKLLFYLPKEQVKKYIETDKKNILKI